MTKTKFAVGDKVEVIGVPPTSFAPGVKDSIGTRKILKSMLWKVYTVRGFDNYGNIELQPKQFHTVWIEPEFLKLRARKDRTRKSH